MDPGCVLGGPPVPGLISYLLYTSEKGKGSTVQEPITAVIIPEEGPYVSIQGPKILS